MRLCDVKVRMVNIELDIAKMIIDFESTTGCYVSGINIETAHVVGHKNPICRSVQIEVQL